VSGRRSRAAQARRLSSEESISGTIGAVRLPASTGFIKYFNGDRYNYTVKQSKIFWRHHSKMRFLMTIVLFLAAAGVVDSFYFDGRNRQAFLDEASSQGQQIRDYVDSLVSNVVRR
jgi:hypothetical protein